MDNMFGYCIAFKSLDLSSFNTKKVITMGGMFQDCHSLISLDLSSFDTIKVTKVYGMFSNCSSLTSLDLSSFNFEKVYNLLGIIIFSNCKSLKKENIKFNKNDRKIIQALYSLND